MPREAQRQVRSFCRTLRQRRYVLTRRSPDQEEDHGQHLSDRPAASRAKQNRVRLLRAPYRCCQFLSRVKVQTRADGSQDKTDDERPSRGVDLKCVRYGPGGSPDPSLRWRNPKFFGDVHSRGLIFHYSFHKGLVTSIDQAYRLEPGLLEPHERVDQGLAANCPSLTGHRGELSRPHGNWACAMLKTEAIQIINQTWPSLTRLYPPWRHKQTTRMKDMTIQYVAR